MRHTDREAITGIRKANETKNRETVVFLKNKNDPSSYYRIFQYLSEYKEIKWVSYASDKMYYWYYGLNESNGNRCHSVIGTFFRKFIFAFSGIVRVSVGIFKLRKRDGIKTIVINREVYPRFLPFPLDRMLQRFLKGKKVIWDLDDNIFFDREITGKEKRILLNTADTILAANPYLKKLIPETYQCKIRILNTSDRMLKQPVPKADILLREKNYQTEIHLLWIGTKDNLVFLQTICASLEIAAERLWKNNRKRVILRCVCNKRLVWKSRYLEIHNLVWTREKAVKELYTAHIGLMPLAVNQYTRGKSGFKAVQYCGAGLPVLASNVGYNREIIQNQKNGFLITTQEEWTHKVIALSTDFNLWKMMSEHSRRIWKQKFDTCVHKRQWKDLLYGR